MRRRVSGYWLVLGFVVAAVWAAGLVVYATTKVRSSHSAPVVSAEPRPEEPPAVVAAPPGPPSPPAPQPRSRVAPPPVAPPNPPTPAQVVDGPMPPRPVVRESAPPPRAVGNDTVDGVRVADALATARTKARATGRLLLVVYHSGGRPEEPVTFHYHFEYSAPVIGAVCLAEPMRLRDKYVVATIDVGPQREGNNFRVVCYLCRPDGGVITAGFSSLSTSSFQWAYELHTRYGDATEQGQVRYRMDVRDTHHYRLPAWYRQVRPAAWLPSPYPPAPVSDRTLQNLSSANWTETKRQFVPFLTGGGRYVTQTLKSIRELPREDQLPLLIAIHPLAPVEDIHEVVWTYILGQPRPVRADAPPPKRLRLPWDAPPTR